jgi:hypothetical protein
MSRPHVMFTVNGKKSRGKCNIGFLVVDDPEAFRMGMTEITEEIIERYKRHKEHGEDIKFFDLVETIELGKALKDYNNCMKRSRPDHVIEEIGFDNCY